LVPNSKGAKTIVKYHKVEGTQAQLYLWIYHITLLTSLQNFALRLDRSKDI
jgi:hypothetical protein